jgi:protein-S-isoprenylcysteine O-methyltransferase Ste14
VTAGLFGRVRNPIYLGVIVQFMGAVLVMPTALSLVALAACLIGLNLVVGSEERFLTARYGNAYRSYMTATGRFLPRGKGTP